MATGIGLNMQGALRAGYGATVAATCVESCMPDVHSRSARRPATSSTSGVPTQYPHVPFAVRQPRKAAGPRQETETHSAGSPSTCNRHSGADHVRRCDARRSSVNASNVPRSAAARASGIAHARGISHASTPNAASAPRRPKDAACQREDPASMRQGADTLDHLCECFIGRGLVPHEPAPELIVLGFQQP